MSSPLQVWRALRDQGATVTEAIGIMANVINESGFNPEAVGDQGTSFGIVQQHGSQYASLVTHHPDADLKAQVRQLALDGGFQAAQGSTVGQAAGNFASRFEQCVGCQPGGAQYESRVANAAVVAGWVRSGKWPTAAQAGAQSAAVSGSSPTASSGSSQGSGGPCVIGFNGVLGLGKACLLTKAELRGIIGAWVMIGSGMIGLVGAVILAAAAFQKTGALAKTADAVAVVPGGGAVAEGLVVAHRRAARSGAQVASERRGARVAAQRQQARQQRQAAASQARQRRASEQQARTAERERRRYAEPIRLRTVPKRKTAPARTRGPARELAHD